MKKKSNIILAGGILFLFVKLLQKGICPVKKYPRPRFQVLEASIERIKNYWLVPQDNCKKLSNIFISYDFHEVSRQKGVFDYNFDMTCYQQYVNKEGTKISFVPLCGDLAVIRPSYYEGFNELVMGSMYISIEALKHLIHEIEKEYELKTVRFYPYAHPVPGKKSVTSLMGYIAVDLKTMETGKVKLSKVPGASSIHGIKVHPDAENGDLLVHMNPCPPHDIDDHTDVEI